jgi:O-antigen/teichoic acid export membrane protein
LKILKARSKLGCSLRNASNFKVLAFWPQRYFVILSIAASSATGLLYLKILQYTLGVDAIGLLSLLTATLFPLRFVDLGISSSCLVEFSRIKNSNHLTINSYACTALAIVSGLSVFAFPLCLAIAYFILKSADVFAIYGDSKLLLLISVHSLSITFGAVSQILASVLDGLDKVKIRSLIQFSNYLLLIPLYLYLISTLGIIGLSLSALIQNILFTFAYIIVYPASLSAVPSIRKVKKLFPRFFYVSSHMTMIGIPPMFFEQLVKIYIGTFGDLSLLGFYELLVQYFSRVKLVLISVVSSYTSSLSDLITNRSLSNTEVNCSLATQNHRLRRYSALIYCACALILPLYLHIFGIAPEFGVIMFSLSLAFAWFFNGLYTINYYCLIISKNFSILHLFNILLYALAFSSSYLFSFLSAESALLGISLGIVFSSLVLRDSVVRNRILEYRLSLFQCT